MQDFTKHSTSYNPKHLPVIIVAPESWLEARLNRDNLWNLGFASSILIFSPIIGFCSALALSLTLLLIFNPARTSGDKSGDKIFTASGRAIDVKASAPVPDLMLIIFAFTFMMTIVAASFTDKFGNFFIENCVFVQIALALWSLTFCIYNLPLSAIFNPTYRRQVKQFMPKRKPYKTKVDNSYTTCSLNIYHNR